MTEHTSAAPTGAPSGPRIEPWLREILRCPRARPSSSTAPARPGPSCSCTSPECGLAYRVDDGIPVLLVDEARSPHPLTTGAPAMAPFLDETRHRRRGEHRRPRLAPDAAGPGHGGRAGARGRSPCPPRRASTGWPAASGPGRCSSPPSAAAPSWPTSSSCWPSPARRCRSASGATCRCPGWVGPLDLVVAVSLSGRASGPAGRSRPRRPAAGRRCSPSAPPSRRWPTSAPAPGACTSTSAAAGPRRARRSGRCSPRCCSRPTRWACSRRASRCSYDTADRLDRGADACRPRSESFVNPAKILAIDAGRARSRWCWATAR